MTQKLSCLDEGSTIEDIIAGRRMRDVIGSQGNRTFKASPFSNWGTRESLLAIPAKIDALLADGVYVLYQDAFSPSDQSDIEILCGGALDVLCVRMEEKDIYFRAKVVPNNTLPQHPKFVRFNLGEHLRATDPVAHKKWMARAAFDINAYVAEPMREFRRQHKRFTQRNILDTADEGARPAFSTQVAGLILPAVETYDKVGFMGAYGLVNIAIAALPQEGPNKFRFKLS